MTVRCLSHLGMTVSDLDAPAESYTRFAGLFEDVERDWARIGLGIGDSQLELVSRRPTTASGDAVRSFLSKQSGRAKDRAHCR